jgi:hemoglobin
MVRNEEDALVSEESLFHKYGGFSTVGSIVLSFYEKVLDTDELRHYFDGIDMERLVRHQTDFMCMVLGGPSNYSGRDLRISHERLRITEEDFFTVADLLEETFEEAGVEDEDIEAILTIVKSTKGDIVNE